MDILGLLGNKEKAKELKLSAYRGMAEEYGLHYDEVAELFDRYDERCLSHSLNHQRKLAKELQELQAELVKASGKQFTTEG